MYPFDKDPYVKSVALPNRFILDGNSPLTHDGRSSDKPMNCAAVAVPDANTLTNT